MPIEMACNHCGAQLRVGDEHAGKRARCPRCGQIYAVPRGGSRIPALTHNRVAALVTTPPSSPSWRMQTEDGEIYGPVTRAELSDWAAEGRISCRCRIQDGARGRWQRADALFPELAPAALRPRRPRRSPPPRTFPRAFPEDSIILHSGQPAVTGTVSLMLAIVGLMMPWLSPMALFLGLRHLRNVSQHHSTAILAHGAVVLGVIGTIRLLSLMFGL